MFSDNYLEDLPFDLSNFIYELKYQLELDGHKKHMGIVFNQFNSLYSHLAIPLFTQLRCSLMTCQCCRNMTNEMIDDDFLELWDPYLTHDSDSEEESEEESEEDSEEDTEEDI